MRFIWLLALVLLCAGWAIHGASAQEGGQPGASAQTDNESSESADEAAQAERRRRFRSGNVAKLEIGGKTIAISYGDTPTEGADYEAVASVADGDVVQMTQSIVSKLKTELELKFGDTVIKTENVAKNYPGVYGLWIKRVGDDWHLVFNEYADVWGTQHFPEGDVAEIPLTYAKAEEPTDKFTVKVEESGAGGTISIIWGERQWTAAFTVAG